MLENLLDFHPSLLLTCAFIWLRGGFVTVFGLTGQSLSMLVYAVTYFVLRWDCCLTC